MKHLDVILISENEYSRKTIPVLLRRQGIQCKVFSTADEAMFFISAASAPVFVIVDSLYPAVEISTLAKKISGKIFVIMNCSEKFMFQLNSSLDITAYVYADEIPGIIAEKHNNWRAA